MNGQFLVLEGADGAGKSSQLLLLAEFFRKDGRTVHTMHFPRLDVRPYGEMIAEYLRGDLGPLASVHPKLAALLYALDRSEAGPDIHAAVAAGHVVLADRYIFSNLAYQCARTAEADKKAELADWIEKLEYGSYAIPRPDLTLYLDVPPEFARANLAATREGADRAYLQGGRDIHEASDELQNRVREEFLALAKNRTGEIGVVDCRGDDGGIADKRTIHSRIVDALRYYGVTAR